MPCAEEVQCEDVTAIVDPMASRCFLSIERNSYSSIHSLTKVFTLRSYLDIVQYINSRKYISRFHKACITETASWVIHWRLLSTSPTKDFFFTFYFLPSPFNFFIPILLRMKCQRYRYTGCFKTSCKFLRLVTQSFFGLFSVFWAFLYHKL